MATSSEISADGVENPPITYLPADVIQQYPFFSRVSARYRQRRVNRFIQVMNITASTRILDVGGYPYFWSQFPVKCAVTCLNLHERHEPAPENVRTAQYDGRIFPFKDGSFDVVHANSVIEHVGNYHAQRIFAQEIRRVGKAFWVQTPDYWFFYEPHAQFPGFQFLPPGMKLWIGKHWKKAGYAHDELLSIQPLTPSQLLDLFPGAAIWREKSCGMTKSLIAYSAGAAQTDPAGRCSDS